MPFKVRESDLDKYDENHWNDVYQGLIRKAVQKAGLQCERVDEDVTNALIIDKIWTKIEEADVIICDLSTSNPNVHLELGWALRADKRFVLIKDDITKINFNLNQFHTYEYSNGLQPMKLEEDINDLTKIIKKTLGDSERQYSIVNKLSINLQAIKASDEGNIQVKLLQELINEVRDTRDNQMQGFQIYNSHSVYLENIKTHKDLAKSLIGTTWRKKNNVETIIFSNKNTFCNNLAGHPIWTKNSYYLGKNLEEMTLNWNVDNLEAKCKFNSEFNKFIEIADPDECVWSLIAKKPYTPPWRI